MHDWLTMHFACLSPLQLLVNNLLSNLHFLESIQASEMKTNREKLNFRNYRSNRVSTRCISGLYLVRICQETISKLSILRIFGVVDYLWNAPLWWQTYQKWAYYGKKFGRYIYTCIYIRAGHLDRNLTMGWRLNFQPHARRRPLLFNSDENS